MSIFWRRGRKPVPEKNLTEQLPKVSVGVAQIRKAIHAFERTQPKGMDRKALLMEGNRLDCTLLAPFLGGVPDQEFYMSRETYQIFPEEDRELAVYMDRVQAAVDDYYDETGKLPVVPQDYNRRISYPVLINGFFLQERPPVDFYMTSCDHMISHHPEGK